MLFLVLELSRPWKSLSTSGKVGSSIKEATEGQITEIYHADRPHTAEITAIDEG